MALAFFAGLPTSWSALGAASALALVGGRPPSRILARVDFLLLLFFAGLFAVVYGLSATGWTERIFAAVHPFFGQGPAAQTVALSAVSLIASNLVRNVPFVMLAGKWSHPSPRRP